MARADWCTETQSPTQTDLADALDIGRASMGSLIDHLEKNGFVARILDPNDRRVWRVVPTKIALGSIEPLDDAAQKVATQAFSSISDNDLSLANKVLAQIQKNLS